MTPKKVLTTNKGFKVIPITLTDTLKLGGIGICDSCNQASFKFQFIGVLNSAYCEKCFDDWHSGATYYSEDCDFEYSKIENAINSLA